MITQSENQTIKTTCSICGKDVDYTKQKSRYYTDDDRTVCKECWNEGKDNLQG